MNLINKITDKIDKYMHYVELQVLAYLISAYTYLVLYIVISHIGHDGMLGLWFLIDIAKYLLIAVLTVFLIYIINLLTFKKHINFSYKFPIVYKVFLYINIAIVLIDIGFIIYVLIDILLSKL